MLWYHFSHNNNVVKIGPHKCLKSDRSSLNMQKCDEEILNNDSWFKFALFLKYTCMNSYDFRRNFLSSAAPLLMKKKSTRDFLPVVWSDKIASKWQNCHFWLNGSFKQWPSWDFSVALMKKIKANDSVWIRGSPWRRTALWELTDPFPAAPWTSSDDQLDNGHILNTTRLG